MSFIKVISGGQRGADTAGLHAAYSLGLPTGGTAPKGYRIVLPDGEDYNNPELGTKYGLVEHESAEWSPRTIQNVKDSDGTVWFGYQYSGGGKLTIGTCIQESKPIIINPTVDDLVSFIVGNSIRILNVAGSSLSKWNPHIYTETYQVMEAVLKKLAIYNNYEYSKSN